MWSTWLWVTSANSIEFSVKVKVLFSPLVSSLPWNKPQSTIKREEVRSGYYNTQMARTSNTTI